MSDEARQATLMQRINAHMNSGRCPTSDALGECCAISPITGASGHQFYVASLYLWTAAVRLKPATVAQWFVEAGCENVTVLAMLHDPDNDTFDGRSTIDGVRPWEVHFSLPRAAH